ncbi:MAG: D-alanyl-D-alanine carboxypeptidase/D-alanyl-D-alanine-endopeptidase [Acidobacteria bacterium]|nr:MAG: D-alanyl-D-alanine carboxypeptidase/D-alanyl-D-alanine-endopeptidase [Acidobacteriota bacterium]
MTPVPRRPTMRISSILQSKCLYRPRTSAVCLLIIICALALPLPLQAAAGPGSLASRIESILRASPAERGFWGIEVVRLSDGEVLYQRNSQHLFLPASNMKMFTTSAALSTLGPNFVFRTTVDSSAAPDSAGRVPDLALVGRGDANLGSRVVPYQYNSPERLPADLDFEQLADQVVAKGVHEVTGNIYADDTYYVFQPYGTGWAVDDLFWDYGAPITALAFNDNSLKLEIRPAAFAGPKAQILMGPGDGYYTIVNDVTTTASGIPATVEINRFPGSMELGIWGHIPAGSTGVDEGISIQDPPAFIGAMFRRLLEQRGVKVDGKVIVREASPAAAAAQAEAQGPEQRVLVAEHDSLPLSQDIKVTLKVSQNLHAEMLLRTMSRVQNNKGSIEDGLNILEGFVQKAGIAPEEVQFADGSGLSRETLVTPDAVMKLLQFDARQPWFQTFYDALPVAGVDGTLRDRFRGTSLQGRIHAKTGSLENVNALSGYMNLPEGRRLAFVIIGNQHPLDEAEAIKVIDHIAFEIYRWYAYRQ